MTDTHSLDQARAHYASIKSLLLAYSDAEGDRDTPPDYDAQDEAREAIQERALDVTVRSGWQEVGQPHASAGTMEFQILLCTGGPAVRIIGTLDEYLEPETARIEHQDWGTPWTEYRDVDHGVLVEFARHFYFGER